MTDIFLTPNRYVQLPGVLNEIGKYLEPFGRQPLVLSDEMVMPIIRPKTESQLQALGMAPCFVLFGTECSMAEVARISALATHEGNDFVVGAGGGKVIDTARVVAQRLELPLVTVATSAATCSACSSVSVLYKNGVREETLKGKGADLALVDSAIIAAAPSRLLSAGMGDALAKFYEGKPTFDRTPQPLPALEAALRLSAQVKETIMDCGLEAKRDVDAGKATFVVEKIVEANIFLTGVISCVGGATFRVALAHGLLYGLTIMPAVHNLLHGEMVSYGLIVQLCLEEKKGELKRLIPFFIQLGLPLTTEEIGIHDLSDPLFLQGLKRTCAQGGSAHNLSVPVSEKSLLAAIREADRRVKRMKRR
ncbi:MAG: iron-containing alcohol dehydrogenase family protein [Desulfobacterales bacterium]